MKTRYNLHKQIRNLKIQLEQERNLAQWWFNQYRKADRSRAGLKGVITKMRKAKP